MWAPDLPRHRGQIFLYGTLVLVNDYKTYKCIIFQLPSCISFGDMVGSKNKNWGLLISPNAPKRTNFYIEP